MTNILPVSQDITSCFFFLFVQEHIFSLKLRRVGSVCDQWKTGFYRACLWSTSISQVLSPWADGLLSVGRFEEVCKPGGVAALVTRGARKSGAVSELLFKWGFFDLFRIMFVSRQVSRLLLSSWEF